VDSLGRLGIALQSGDTITRVDDDESTANSFLLSQMGKISGAFRVQNLTMAILEWDGWANVWGVLTVWLECTLCMC
jgi:hypothetical protein